jgi:hypothetical protein
MGVVSMLGDARGAQDVCENFHGLSMLLFPEISALLLSTENSHKHSYQSEPTLFKLTLEPKQVNIRATR